MKAILILFGVLFLGLSTSVQAQQRPPLADGFEIPCGDLLLTLDHPQRVNADQAGISCTLITAKSATIFYPANMKQTGATFDGEALSVTLQDQSGGSHLCRISFADVPIIQGIKWVNYLGTTVMLKIDKIDFKPMPPKSAALASTK